LLTNRLLIDPVNNIIILAATAIGASLPDIDEYNSSASKKSVINFSLFLDIAGLHILFLVGQFFLVVYII
jgi:inner membrane protein